MTTIKLCSEVSDTQIFETFEAGFIDYMIQIKMEEAMFIERFFGPEGNDRALSYIAFEDDKPVGITLGGLKTDEAITTLRCGGMSVIPEARGTGIAKTLMEHHIQKAKEIGCRQLFLEVIDGNDRAIAFYKKMGYENVYNLTYRTWKLNEHPFTMPDDAPHPPVEIMTFEDIHTLRTTDYSHLPWQASFDYVKDLPCNYYGIKEQGEVVAGIVATATRIVYLWVHPDKREKGYARALLHRVITDLSPEVLHISYANNASAHTFCNHYRMDIEAISQLEMYRWLG